MSATTTPSRSGRPGSDIPCPPPTDPTGFIYPTYRAAQTEASRDKPLLKCSHQRSAYVSSAVGGSVSTLSFEDTKTSNRLSHNSNRLGGSTRDRVRGFSRESRWNLLRRLASINRGARTVQETPQSLPQAPSEGVRVIRCLLEVGYTEQRGMALSSATVREAVYWSCKRTAPLHIVFLV